MRPWRRTASALVDHAQERRDTARRAGLARTIGTRTRPPEKTSPSGGNASLPGRANSPRWLPRATRFQRSSSGWFPTPAPIITAGFKRAAEIYQGKFQRHTETLLYAVLPAAIIALGLMIAAQGYMAISSIAPFLKSLMSVDGM
jgi:hypothetical protein